MIISTTTINLKETGIRLKRYAKCYGYSVKDIQHYLGLSCPQPIYRWYKGAILPSVDNLLKLSQLFHVHMENLLAQNTEFRYHSSNMRTIELKERITAYYSKIVV